MKKNVSKRFFFPFQSTKQICFFLEMFFFLFFILAEYLNRDYIN